MPGINDEYIMISIDGKDPVSLAEIFEDAEYQIEEWEAEELENLDIGESVHFEGGTYRRTA